MSNKSINGFHLTAVILGMFRNIGLNSVTKFGKN